MSSIEAIDLCKSYKIKIAKHIEVLKKISFSIPEGQITGYLGPNGAGKTTTFKILTGLIKASSGEAKIAGIDCKDAKSRQLLGYLPEAPYFYEHLTAEESLYFYASLFGLKAKKIKQRAYELMERFGLLDAKDRKLQTYSKGMRQRLGFAQCLINDPQIIILDEPMSGLDPIGRKDFRDMILELKAKGKTVLLSSHILNDIENICNRIILLSGGVIREEGKLSEVLAKTLRGTEVTFMPANASFAQCLPQGHFEIVSKEQGVTVNLQTTVDVNSVLKKLLESNHLIIKVVPQNESLENYFIRIARGG